MNPTRSILHVEDDADDVYFLSRALRESAVTAKVDVVNDGQAAVDYLQKAAAAFPQAATAPGLVILDLNLPHKSGLEVLRWIRQESPWSTIIVIVLTSSTSESDMHEAYSLGANAYTIKPSDASRLREWSDLLKQFWFHWNQMPPLPYFRNGVKGASIPAVAEDSLAPQS